MAAILKPALGDDLPIIKDEIQAGACECWHIRDHGYMVTRLENNPASKTLVIVAGVGQKARPVFEIMPKVAKANGAKWLRVHSKRKGMARYLYGLGYSQTWADNETIFFKRVQ